MDYYRRASALPKIPRIEVPTFILSARDDPFIAVPPLEELQAARTRAFALSPKGVISGSWAATAPAAGAGPKGKWPTGSCHRFVKRTYPT